MTEEPLTLGSLLAFIRERMRMKWGDGPIQSPTDQALCPQMKPGWPPDQGA